mmetsp:Transcript_37934/g.76092  ORF Transcript_37934/g.76092 Transcript_37934/m.76092 type:complete len:83 (+) Transcript_37934:1102-1350(+)
MSTELFDGRRHDAAPDALFAMAAPPPMLADAAPAARFAFAAPPPMLAWLPQHRKARCMLPSVSWPTEGRPNPQELVTAVVWV